MKEEFLDEFCQWMDNNLMSWSWYDDTNDVVEIKDFGKLYFFDSDSVDKIFKGEDKLGLQIPEPIDELIDDEIFYAIIKWGDNFYYTDLRGDVDLKILKFLGECSIQTDYEYVNLGVHTPFELLNGSFLPDMWAKKAKFLGHNSIGICDKNTMAGTLLLQKACNKEGINPIFGYSLDVIVPEKPKLSYPEYMEKHGHDPMAEEFYDEYCELVGDGIPEKKFGGKVYTLTDEGFGHMLRIQKAVMVDNFEDPHISIEELTKRGTGNAFVFDKFSSEHLDEDIVSQIMSSFDQVYYQFDMSEFKADRFDVMVLESAKKYLDNWNNQIPPILICDNYYLDKDDFRNKIVLNKIAHGTAHQQSQDQYFKHVNDHIETIDPLFEGYKENPDCDDWYNGFLKEITSNTLKIANAAKARIETGVVFMPEYEMKDEEIEKYGDRRTMFLELLEDGLEEFVPDEKVDEYRDRLDSEIYVIESSNNIDYFLILWDIVNEAKISGIQTGVGRGSAGGSLVSYLMGITTIDPMGYDLIFERFLTPERCGLEPQDVTVLADEVDIESGEEYVEIETDDGILKLLPESEMMVKRGEETIEVRADELQEGDDIVWDRKDEIWDIPEIIQ